MNRLARMALCLLTGLISRVIPRADQIWAFGGNKGVRFADNSMFFFKYCVEETDKTSVWLTKSDKILTQVRSEGYRAYKSNSLRGLYYGFRARWHIFDVSASDTSAYSSVGAKQLNLWHGYPIKDIRFLKKEPKNSFLRSVWAWLCNRHLARSNYFVLHQNKKYLWHITESFHVKEEHVVIANYPRNIVFENSDRATAHIASNAKPVIEKLEKLRESGKRILGYFPTWRPSDSDQFMGTRSVEELTSLNDFLAEHNLVIATKWHTCVFKEYQHAGASTAAEDLNSTMHSMSNIVVLEFDQDLNSLLTQFDLLISDYSGVIIDYLFSDRPQILMAYDLESYSQEPGFFFDYQDFAPGPIVKTIAELECELVDYAKSPESYAAEYQAKRVANCTDVIEAESGSEAIFKFLNDSTA